MGQEDKIWGGWGGWDLKVKKTPLGRALSTGIP